MAHSCGHSHAKFDRRGSTLAERGKLKDRINGFVDDAGLTGEESPAHANRRAPTQSEIAALAYSYWEARGYRDGSPWEDWFKAECELKECGR